jgi:hypothetical protein
MSYAGPPIYSDRTPEHLNTSGYFPGAMSSETLRVYDDELAKASKLKKQQKGISHLDVGRGEGSLSSHHPIYRARSPPDNSNIVLNRGMQKNKVRLTSQMGVCC